MTILCPNCGTVQNANTTVREETYTYKGEPVTLQHELSVCAVCGTEVATAQQAEESLIAVREVYRNRHGLISPDEIRSIRQRYGAGQKPFGIILGLGESTIANYERGELPTAANSNLIRLMDDPNVFRALFDERHDLIGPTQRKRIEPRLNGDVDSKITIYGGLVTRETADEYTGFRQPDEYRVEAILGFIVDSLDESVYKTKLLKLCFLIDFEHFRRHTVSITGWPYARLPHGPVLQEYKSILETAEQNGVIQTEDFDDGKTVVRIGDRGRSVYERSEFTEDEQTTIRDVLRRWGSKSAKELSQYTHKLSAWNHTDHAQEISYLSALDDETVTEARPDA
ncbi:MAG: type II TA system antitoxin MqsA family protein [Alkalispirochaeta sp.]